MDASDLEPLLKVQLQTARAFHLASLAAQLSGPMNKPPTECLVAAYGLLAEARAYQDSRNQQSREIRDEYRDETRVPMERLRRLGSNRTRRRWAAKLGKPGQPLTRGDLRRLGKLPALENLEQLALFEQVFSGSDATEINPLDTPAVEKAATQGRKAANRKPVPHRKRPA